MGCERPEPKPLRSIRIEAGVPKEGVDAGENYIVLETELNEAVSYTKGCYLGQEIIARIHWRGQPAKRLRGLLVEADETPRPGDEIWGRDKKSARSPRASTVRRSIESSPWAMFTVIISNWEQSSRYGEMSNRWAGLSYRTSLFSRRPPDNKLWIQSPHQNSSGTRTPRNWPTA